MKKSDDTNWWFGMRENLLMEQKLRCSHQEQKRAANTRLTDVFLMDATRGWVQEWGCPNTPTLTTVLHEAPSGFWWLNWIWRCESWSVALVKLVRPVFFSSVVPPRLNGTKTRWMETQNFKYIPNAASKSEGGGALKSKHADATGHVHPVCFPWKRCI